MSFRGKDVSRRTQPSSFLLLWKGQDLFQLLTKSLRIQDLVHGTSCTLHKNRYNYSKKNPSGECMSWAEECGFVVKAPDWASASLGFISGLTTASFCGFVDKLLDLSVLQFFIWSTGSTSVPHILRLQLMFLTTKVSSMHESWVMQFSDEGFEQGLL